MNLKFLTIILFVIFLPSCVPPIERVNQARMAEDANQLTLGKIQQTLKKGIKQDVIVLALGSPNMVTVDSAGLEIWIYDKLRTEVSSASAKDSVNILGGVIGGSAGIGGAVGSSSGASNQITSQKTLTVVLKFKNKTLEDYKYNATTF
jgi:outer membrane protein assembly factor BamE (lipoprotein component of BamABCDE complex)